MKLAIMQPCFIPYPGYFRLLCAADLFVVYDCVQFPRRGWVHRNQLKVATDKLDWLTLPLQKQPMNTIIKELRFRDNAHGEWESLLNQYPAIRVIKTTYPELYAAINDINLSPSEYIVNILSKICQILAIPFNITYSALLNIPAEIRGQDRILHIARFHQATNYVNASGGRELYQEEVFRDKGINLHFLPDYQGSYHSIIQCLAEQEPDVIRKNIYSQL